MEHREMEYVIVIAQEKNLSKAAERLFISQPALSRFLTKLENELGTPLFERKNRQYLPTYAGELYLDTARQILRLQQQFDARLKSLLQTNRGVMSMGITPGRGHTILPLVLPAFQAQFPDYELQVYEEDVETLERYLLDGTIEVAFFTMLEQARLAEKRYVCELLSQEELVICTPRQGNYELLAKPNIDTGMGLERLAVVMQDVNNLFEVDTVAAVLHHVERISGKKYGENEKDDISIRVITDHIRATVFMASDGILPSNEGRGYVMRRLLRRAARHGRMLGINRPFLTELVETVIESSEAGYPELREHESYIKKVIGTEELRFGRTIDAGLNILTGMMGRLKEAHEKVLSGVEAFKLNDTFGFPLDLTREIAAEAGFAVDEAAFHIEMTKQRERARAERLAKDISGWSADLFGELTAEPTQFDGYETLSEKAKVLALSDGEELVDAIATDEAGEAKDGVLVVLDRTPFYAEMGGQVADHGYLVSGDAKLKVTQVKKTPKGYFVHTCELLDGTIHVDDEVTASVDEKRRAAICRNHTATHLLQKALREVLGEHVHQAGSYQDDQITHFDFTHFSAVSPAELAEVERRVNEKIYEALPVTVKNLPIEEAKKMGAMALFGEKYGSVVRVVDAGGWSTEFCGGTHVTNTAQIGCFKILSESSVAAGIRRIEATTAFGVLDLLDDRTEILAKTAVALKANNLKDAPARAEALAAELKETAKQLEILKAQMAAAKIDGLFENAADIDGVRIVSAYLTGTGADTLRDMVDKVRDKAPNAVTVLIGSDGNKTMMAVGVSKNAMARGLKAGALVKKIAAIAGGNGGGKPDFAMAGIRDTSKIDDALNAVPEIVKAEMNQ